MRSREGFAVCPPLLAPTQCSGCCQIGFKRLFDSLTDIREGAAIRSRMKKADVSEIESG
jgi:hypothetical protein